MYDREPLLMWFADLLFGNFPLWPLSSDQRTEIWTVPQVNTRGHHRHILCLCFCLLQFDKWKMVNSRCVWPVWIISHIESETPMSCSCFLLIIVVILSENSHDYGTLLTPDTLGGVLGLHVGVHAVLLNTRDVPLDHIGAVVSVGKRESRLISGTDKSVLQCFL